MSHSWAGDSGLGSGPGFDPQEPGAFSPSHSAALSGQRLSWGLWTPWSSPGEPRPRERKSFARGCPEVGAEPGGGGGSRTPAQGFPIQPCGRCKSACLLLFPPEKHSCDDKQRDVLDTGRPRPGSWTGGSCGALGDGPRGRVASASVSSEAPFNLGPCVPAGRADKTAVVGALSPARSYGRRGAQRQRGPAPPTWPAHPPESPWNPVLPPGPRDVREPLSLCRQAKGGGRAAGSTRWPGELPAPKSVLQEAADWLQGHAAEPTHQGTWVP